LTQDCQQLTGGILHVETDPVRAADAILAHIEANRKKLGI
jgi:carbon-monoxide dehydrogenase catalytic subunit